MTELNAKEFSLTSYEPAEVKMPEKQSVTEEDIDAQLFEYVANSGRGSRILSINDLNDEWVQETFPNHSSIAELRDWIASEISREYLRAWEAEKFERCIDCLVDRLEGEVDEQCLEESLEAMKFQYEERLRSFGLTKQKYLESERITEEEYELQMRNDVLRRMKFDVILQLIVEHDHVTVAEDEIPNFLSCDNPETYVDTLRENGSLPAALQAAAKVKAMRAIVKDAVITVE